MARMVIVKAASGHEDRRLPASRRRCLLASYGALDRETKAGKRTDEIVQMYCMRPGGEIHE